MKNLAYLSFTLLLLIAVFAGCDKSQTYPTFDGKLIASSTSVNPGEADSLIVLGADNDPVTWDISPKTYTIVKQQNNKLILTFQAFGAYTIKATVNGKVLTALVGCWDNGTVTHLSFNDVNVVLTPRYYRSKTSTSPDSIYFTLTAQVQTILGCANTGIQLRQDRTNNNFTVNFYDITQPDSPHCLPPTSTNYPVITIPYDQDSDPGKRYVPNVSYPLTIKKGSTTYTGSILFTHTAMDITWDYTSGVTFTSKHAVL
jgi:hypothetical protein